MPRERDYVKAMGARQRASPRRVPSALPAEKQAGEEPPEDARAWFAVSATWEFPSPALTATGDTELRSLNTPARRRRGWRE
jgi:hypothetical protein